MHWYRESAIKDVWIERCVHSSKLQQLERDDGRRRKVLTNLIGRVSCQCIGYLDLQCNSINLKTSVTPS